MDASCPKGCLLCDRCLLIEPFPESALNEEAGKLLLEDYEEYAKHAKLMTSIHAQPPKRSEELFYHMQCYVFSAGTLSQLRCILHVYITYHCLTILSQTLVYNPFLLAAMLGLRHVSHCSHAMGA